MCVLTRKQGTNYVFTNYYLVLFDINCLCVHVELEYIREVELESVCLSGQVRPPLYSFNSTQPLGCLGSSVVRASA